MQPIAFTGNPVLGNPLCPAPPHYGVSFPYKALGISDAGILMPSDKLSLLCDFCDTNAACLPDDPRKISHFLARVALKHDDSST